MSNMNKRFNTLLTGILAGTIIPAILFMLFYMFQIKKFDLGRITEQLLLRDYLPQILSWCIIPNLILFFVFNWLNWLKSAKGILIATVISTVLLFLLKFIFSIT